jgi:hypothetical protein
MLLSKFWQSVSLNALVISGLTLIVSHHAWANTELAEDKLNTDKSLSWGGQGLPFNDVVTVRDALVNSIVGKLVIDRHGEDNKDQQTGVLGGLFNAMTIRDPFAGPNPGRLTIVTLWGSKEEGCFVKAMVHNAPKNTSENARNFVPMQMEVGVGDRVIKLTPATKSVPKTASGTYKYTLTNKSEVTAPYYFAENTFAINGKVADILRNAPAGEAKVRVTFANGDTKVFPIGAPNVARWRDAYGYNPNCKANN